MKYIQTHEFLGPGEWCNYDYGDSETVDFCSMPKAAHCTFQEVYEAYESWRDKGLAAYRALLTIWKSLGEDRKHMTFGDDPQVVVNEFLASQHPNRIERVEVIDEAGRQYARNHIARVQAVLQDDGKTLKIFLNGDGDGPLPGEIPLI